ncbi:MULTISPECIES: hypothetical protein [Rahnella]|uniref:hypothetical protein n=1 Tax=Rahnella TaxID=34037 RepID=UPI000EFA3AD5|nr:MULTISPECIES: hypothetical protein [Rahnella]MBB6117099.1 hypothetical protein [Rahnella inusitata]MBU9830274.1 hypothetical protein [Rahnella rivi]THD40389.1 hypothetical protein ERD95_25415 [Enterobacteriaceae bacterium ML5]
MRTIDEILKTLPPEIVANYHRNKEQRRIVGDMMFTILDPCDILVGILAQGEETATHSSC